MKHVYQALTVCLSMLLFSSLLAQEPRTLPGMNPHNFPLMPQSIDWDLLPVKIPAEDFVLAGFKFGGMSHEEGNLWKEAGLNTCYHDYSRYYKKYNPSSILNCQTDYCDRPEICNTPLAPFMTNGFQSFSWFHELYGKPHPNLSYNITENPPAGSGEELLKNHWILPSRDFKKDGKDDPDDFSREASEIRYFVASNSDHLDDDGTFNPERKGKTFAYDLIYNWDLKLGKPATVGPVSAPIYTHEWKVSNSEALIDGDYILKGLQEGRPGPSGENGSSTFGFWRYTPKLYCDFIYRIDASPDGDWDNRNHPSTTNSTTPLYQVEYILHYTKNNTRYDYEVLNTSDDDITFQKSQTFTYPNNEKSDATDFPNSTKFLPNVRPGGNVLPSHQYAIQRKAFDYFVMDDGAKYNVDSFECRLRAYHQSGDDHPNVSFYIRGLRVRSKLAEDILSGSFDEQLKQVFRNKRTSLIQSNNGLSEPNKKTAWDNTKMFTSTGEPTIDGIRIHAYVSELCYKTIGRYIVPFLSNNIPHVMRPEWYRAAYEEQTGKVPPPISMEDLEKFGNWDKNLPMPADAIPYKLRADNDFKSTFFYPISGRTIPYSDPNPFASGLQTHIGDIRDFSNSSGIWDYDGYTRRMQIRYSHTLVNYDPDLFPNIIEDKFCFRRSASSIRPPWASGIDNEYGKYLAHISLITTFNTDGLTLKEANNSAAYCIGPIGSERSDRETIAKKTLNIMRKALNISSAPNEQLLGGNPLLEPVIPMEYRRSGDNHDFYSLSPSNNKAFMNYRVPTRFEVRTQGWNALCNGARGFVFNPIGSDLGGNVGWSLNKWVDGSGVEHSWSSFDYGSNNDLTKPTFMGFFGAASVGTDAYPIVPIATNLSEQSSTEKFTDHIVKVGVSYQADEDVDGDEETCFGTVYKTIPLFDSQGRPIDEQPTDGNHKNFLEYIAEHHSDYDDLLANNTPILNKSTNNFLRQWIDGTGYHESLETIATNDWAFVAKEKNKAGTDLHVATCKEFESGLTTASNCTLGSFNCNDGGNLIRNKDLNHWDPACERRPFYQRIFHYPQSNARVSLYVPTFYGYKEKHLAATRLIDDVLPIAKTISKINWVTSVDYSGLFSSSLPLYALNEYWENLSHFPILSNRNSSPQNQFIRSFKFKRFGTPWQLLESSDLSSGTKYPNPTDGLEDANERKYFELGLFVDPLTDPKYVTGNPATQFFMAIANKRTWPMYYRVDNNGNLVKDSQGNLIIEDKDPTSNNAYEYLGGVDARRFSFKIDHQKFINASQSTIFNVTDLRTGREKLMTVADTFCRDFEPGEGTLLKISPITSMSAGDVTENGMAFNNGHRIAELPSSGILPKRVMVWENDGNIEMNVTNHPAPQPQLENFVALSEKKIIYDKSGSIDGKAQHPSVACRENEVMIVYSTYNGTDRKVFAECWKYEQILTDPPAWVRKAKASIDGHQTTPGITDGLLPKATNQPNHLITPVITPGRDGYFVAWSNSDNNGVSGDPEHYIEVAHIRLDNNGGTDVVAIDPVNPNIIRSEIPIQGPQPLSEVFPTVASRKEDEFIANSTQQAERFHLAWETDWVDGTSQIYYTRYDRDFTTGVITQFLQNPPIERLTDFAYECKHTHPNIAVQNNKHVNANFEVVPMPGEPIVAWERLESNGFAIGQKDDGKILPSVDTKAKSVIVRRRLGLGNWSSYTTLSPIANNSPLPVIQPGSFVTFFSPITKVIPFYRITYMDSVQKELRVSKVILSSDKVATSEHKRLLERGMYPNILLNYILGNTSYSEDPELMRTLTFRGNLRIYNGENNNYHYTARVTAPLLENILKSVDGVKPVKTLRLLKRNTCKKQLQFSIGTPTQRPAIWCTGCPDTIYFNIGSGIPLDWNNYDITDTRPGYYSESDTTIFHWPRTEDSVRTEDFEYSLGDTLGFDRMFYMEDTAWVRTLINDSTLGNINYSVLLKDSASGQTIATLDQITIDTASIDIAVKRFGEDNITSVSAFLAPMPLPTSFYVPQGPGRKVQWIANALAPSGKAYITIHASKDEDMPVVMSQEHGEYDNFDVIIPMFDTVAFKQAGQQPVSQSVSTTPVTLNISPNPFEESTRVTVETVKDVPLSVQVYNVLGGLVADLFNEMSTQTHYEFTLDSKIIRPGTYFIRAQAGNGIVTKKVQFVK